MEVFNYTVPAEVEEALLKRMQDAPFTSMDIQSYAEELGIPKYHRTSYMKQGKSIPCVRRTSHYVAQRMFKKHSKRIKKFGTKFHYR